MSRLIRRTSVRGEEAQAIVEFGMVVTVLLFFFLGTIDFSRFIYYDSAIRNGARVGAEVAGNYCNVPGCGGNQSSPTSDDIVMEATYCEATQNTLASGLTAVSLSPTTSCSPCTSTTCADPCASSTCTPCTKDICISPSGTRTPGNSVTVSVGYNFTPINPLMQQFFPAQSCYTGDSTFSNHHTLCASMVGRVSGH